MEILNKFIVLANDKTIEQRERTAKNCALICVDEKYNGILYVLGELKSRGELSEKIFLKTYKDMLEEKQNTIEKIKNQ